MSKCLLHVFYWKSHLNFFFKCLFILEREREWTGEGQRERERESQADSALSAQSPMWGSNSTNCEIMTWAEVWCLTDWATQVPLHQISFTLRRSFQNQYFPLWEGVRDGSTWATCLLFFTFIIIIFCSLYHSDREGNIKSNDNGSEAAIPGAERT